MEEAEDEKREREDAGDMSESYQLSVFAGPLEEGEGPDDLVARLFGKFRRVKFYRSAPVGVLLEAGFTLVASPPDPYHYDALLGPRLTAEVIERFDDCFSEARRNPAWR
ncbi:hypothetical protein [Streptomyces xinghaiensis]|uniref:hypothetical protein n=1 Tax=Streptomyces xinghaiensis TaxID=1038928 RepID=UPI0012FF7ADA|nr:hypothetical protein [Streptomyces xinghaiensis]MZE80855.1 hypothetical protein [Streptomyces sp. SID5475]